MTAVENEGVQSVRNGLDGAGRRGAWGISISWIYVIMF